MTRFGALDHDYLAIAMDAVRGAVAGADLSRIDRIYFSSFAPTELCQISHPAAAIAMSLESLYPELDADLFGPFITGGEALFHALSGWEGDGDALVIACEKMTHVEAATAAGLLAPRVNPREGAYGATLPALSALVTQAYLKAYSVPPTALNHVAAKNHAVAAMNPKAHFQKPVPLDRIATSPLVADPLRRFHCAPMSDGAAAILLGNRGDVAITGWAHGRDTELFCNRADLARFVAARRASQDALTMAGRSHSDVDVVEIHDAFSSFELLNLEEMGFFPLGQSWRALLDGQLMPGGRIAVNPSGGLKARGHPIGACGAASLCEVGDQLTNRAGQRQQPDAAVAMIQSAGGVSADTYMFVCEGT